MNTVTLEWSDKALEWTEEVWFLCSVMSSPRSVKSGGRMEMKLT